MIVIVHKKPIGIHKRAKFPIIMRDDANNSEKLQNATVGRPGFRSFTTSPWGGLGGRRKQCNLIRVMLIRRAPGGCGISSASTAATISASSAGYEGTRYRRRTRELQTPNTSEGPSTICSTALALRIVFDDRTKT